MLFRSRAPLPCGDPTPADDLRQAGLADLVPADTRKAYDVRKVITRMVDPDSQFEIQPTYAKNAVTCLARLGGRPVGIIANQPMQLGGMLTSPACEKIAH